LKEHGPGVRGTGARSKSEKKGRRLFQWGRVVAGEEERQLKEQKDIGGLA